MSLRDAMSLRDIGTGAGRRGRERTKAPCAV